MLGGEGRGYGAQGALGFRVSRANTQRAGCSIWLLGIFRNLGYFWTQVATTILRVLLACPFNNRFACFQRHRNIENPSLASSLYCVVCLQSGYVRSWSLTGFSKAARPGQKTLSESRKTLKRGGGGVLVVHGLEVIDGEIKRDLVQISGSRGSGSGFRLLHVRLWVSNETWFKVLVF